MSENYFTQTKLALFLSQVFFQQPFTKFIVPLQGNFRNPQDGGDETEPRTWLSRAELLDPRGNLKPDTWIGFLKTDSNPRVMAHWVNDPEVQYTRVFTNSQVRLQIVGAQSENWAESVKHWLLREDVQTILAGMDAQLYADELGRMEVSTFVQAGFNSILAYNVFFKVEWASTIDAAPTQLITDAQLEGLVTAL